MVRTVVTEMDSDLVLLSNVSKDNGYFMSGNKGDYILGRDTNGKFIWVKATPGNVTKPVHAYETLQDAIKAKLDKGYDVFEYTDVDFN